MNEDDRAYYYALFKSSLFEFVKYFLSDHLTAIIPDFHREIYTQLPDTERLCLAAPRGSAKSTITSVFFPLWLALFEKRKDIVIISASEGLAIELLRKIKREIEYNPKIKFFFGDLGSNKWTENHIVLKNSKRVSIRARGAGGQIRGFRPDVVICDDIETDESVESEEQRKKLKDWLFKACLNTLLPGGQFIIIGTIIHPLCVLNDLLASDNDWPKKRYTAYKDGIQETGNELWPDLWPHNKLQERKREIGSWAFASEFMNNPVSDETAPIKENQIRYWKELPHQYSCVIAVDPAYSEEEHADYKVAVVVAIDQNLNRYLLSYVRTHAPQGEYFNAIANLWLQHKSVCTGLGIPSGGVEKSFYQSFLKHCESKNLYPNVVELKNVVKATAGGATIRGKKARIINALQPLFESGKYYIHANHYEAREELLTVGSSRWDDLVDAMAYAEQILQPIYFDMKMYEDGVNEVERQNRGSTGYGI